MTLGTALSSDDLQYCPSFWGPTVDRLWVCRHHVATSYGRAARRCVADASCPAFFTSVTLRPGREPWIHHWRRRRYPQ